MKIYKTFGLIFVIIRDSIASTKGAIPPNFYFKHLPIKMIKDIVEAIQDKKGHDIIILDMSKVDGAPATQFIICTGKSTTQVSSIADNVREEVQKKTGEKPINYDGYRNSQWIVIDYGDTMVHVFLPEMREFYRLEELWSDAETIKIADED